MDCKASRLVSQKWSASWRATIPDPINISENFSLREFTAALQHLEPGKASGPDFIFPELIIHNGAALKSLLRDFLSSCLRRLKMSKISRRALVVAIPKPMKPLGALKTYLCFMSPTRSSRSLSTPMSSQFLTYCFLKSRLGLTQEVNRRSSCSANEEHRGFFRGKKADVVFVNLKKYMSNDTVWYRGITCKLLRLLSNKHMIKMIMKLVRNRHFNLTTDYSKQSRLRRLKNGISQRSVLAPLLLNIHTNDLSSTNSRKFAYIL